MDSKIEPEHLEEAIKEYEKGLTLLKEKLHRDSNFRYDQTIELIKYNAQCWLRVYSGA